MEDYDIADGCGIDGKATDPVTKQEFNRWVARVLRYHLEPMKKDLALTKEALYGTEHDPGKGLVNTRDWICRGAIMAGTIAGGIMTLVATIVPIVHWIGDMRGWW